MFDQGAVVSREREGAREQEVRVLAICGVEISAHVPLEDLTCGVGALEQGDHGRFAELMNRNFDMRSSFFPIADRDREMVAIARELAASGKLCGSGGAIVGQLRDAADVGRLQEAYDAGGYCLVRPRWARDD